jgi:hypothetical protein
MVNTVKYLFSGSASCWKKDFHFFEDVSDIISKKSHDNTDERQELLDNILSSMRSFFSDANLKSPFRIFQVDYPPYNYMLEHTGFLLWPIFIRLNPFHPLEKRFSSRPTSERAKKDSAW